MKILFVGDIVGQTGLDYVRECLPALTTEFAPDLVIANAENVAAGRGIKRNDAEALYDAGVEILTLGNHTWDQREVFTFIDGDARIVRPANYPPGTPGLGYTRCRVGKTQMLIVSLMGRTFLSTLDCPFRTLDAILEENRDVKHIFVDIHAETTSEKLALAWEFAGRVSAVIGTHTHVQTADERILPGGTAYLTDVGMVGPRDGILGMERKAVIQKFRTHLPVRFEVAGGARQFCAVKILVDDATGRATSIERTFITDSLEV